MTQHLLTVEQAADHLQVHPPTIGKWIKVGRLPAIDVGSGERAFYRPKVRDLTKAAKPRSIEPRAYDWRALRR